MTIHRQARQLTSGISALVRHIWRRRVLYAEPVTVVEDTAERVVVFLRAGTAMKSTRIDFSTATIGRTVDKEWHSTDVLKIMEPGAWFAIWAIWRRDGGPFLGWYVNLQEPFRRTTAGFDTWDLTLDIVVSPDLRWRWKDEDDFSRAQELGWITPRSARNVRIAAQSAIERIENKTAPFNEPWPSWRPDPAWEIPVLPAAWSET